MLPMILVLSEDSIVEWWLEAQLLYGKYRYADSTQPCCGFQLLYIERPWPTHGHEGKITSAKSTVTILVGHVI